MLCGVCLAEYLASDNDIMAICIVTVPPKSTEYSISIVKTTRCTNISNLFCFGINTLHVSDGLSVHHQEFKTVHMPVAI